MDILVTGGLGFIGSAVAKRLHEDGHRVMVLDSCNEYYDISLKYARQAHLISQLPFHQIDITDTSALTKLFDQYHFDVVCHLAAQAGVRYSVEAPEVYIATNIQGTQNLFEAMKKAEVKRMVFASTSSVYGTNSPMPFREDVSADRPVSVYAMTKRSAELLAHSYFIQSQIETTALRFFTVYGPWSRPDMAMMKFTKSIIAGEPIDLYNHGNLKRDFTYIDDIVEAFVTSVTTPLGYQIINVSNGSPTELSTFVSLLENELGVAAKKNLLPMQTGDVYETYADITKAKNLLGYVPKTSLQAGTKAFIDWYTSYYQ